MPCAFSRRTFLKASIAAAGAAAWATEARAGAASSMAGRGIATRTPVHDRVVVLFHLAGGNDGLNTIIPFRDDAYYALRPSLALARRRMLPLTDGLAFNDRLAPLAGLYARGSLAIILGVGAPNGDRSHVGACRAWHTAADPSSGVDSGWLGRHFGARAPACCRAFTPQGATAFKPPINPPRKGGAASWPDVDQARHDACAHASRSPLLAVADDIARGAAIRAYHVALPGFDTHANQAEAHDALLHTFALAMAGFEARLRASGDSRRVLLMAYSEFGRGVAENASRGTDHGGASAVFLMGDAVRGGLYGSVAPLMAHGAAHGAAQALPACEHSVDLRAIYAAIVEGWLGGDSAQVLGGAYAPLACLA